MNVCAGEEIANIARGWLGTPYRHQGAVKSHGTDCLGLLRGVWQEFYGQPSPKPMPYSADMRDMVVGQTLQSAAHDFLVRQPENAPLCAGDILLFRYGSMPWPRHCGIVEDAHHFIHAQNFTGVVRSSLDASWRKRIAGHYAFPKRAD